MSDHRATKATSHRRSFGQVLCHLILRTVGWRILPFPPLDKAVVAGGPHTSNWDGVVGLLGGAALGLQPTFLIKSSAFKWPLGPVLRHLGGVPIDRSHRAGVVGQAVEEFSRQRRLVLVVTPEGTRTNAPRWKTGFYHIARQAGVPIVVAVADYSEKTISFPAVIQPSESIEADIKRIIEWFGSATPRHPDKLSAPVKAVWDKDQKEGR